MKRAPWTKTQLAFVLVGSVSLAWPVSLTVLRRAAPAPTPTPTQAVPVPPATQPLQAAARPAPKKKTQQVSVRLFSQRKVVFLTVEGDHGLYWKNLKFSGLLTLSIERGRILLRQGAKRVARAPHMELMAAEGAMDIHQPRAPGRRTSGILEISVRNGELLVVNQLDLETYVLGVVQPELGSLKLPSEAMKAQIIAARSYFLAMSNRHPRQPYEFCDGPHCQVYAGMGHYPPRFLAAAQAVRGLYLTYHGRPAAAFFYHSCGGMTAAIEDIWPGQAIPYLRSVADGTPTPYCHLAPHNEWTFRIERHALRNCFAKQGWIKRAESLDTLRVVRRNKSGRAAQILVQSSQPRWVRADRFLHAVNRAFGREVLLSTNFEIYREGEYFRFEGKGWGHGVGMCQSGAIVMARRGKTYGEILQHYFPGTKIALLPDKPYAPKPDPSFLNYLRSLTQ